MTDNDVPPEGPLFTPLDPTEKEIRLLQIAPYDTDVLSICSCTLTKTSLSRDPPPRYNAFSYEWNYDISIPEIGTAILVNGHRLQVTKNLAALLTRYRSIRQCVPDGDPFQIPVWIDALCIDQANPDERNNQVALMGAIFGCAEATLTWLGESENDSDYAMEMVASIGSKIIRSMRSDIMAWVDPPRQPELWQLDGDGSDGRMNRFWDSISSLMNRSYWKRAWIVQEILLQPNVIIFCGRNILSYYQLNAVYHWLRSIQGKPCPPGVDAKLWASLSTRLGWYSMGFNNFLQRRSFKDPEGKGADELDERERHLRWKAWILNTKFQQATDPRDHLYSVLGLVGVYVLQPDYSLSAETVFCNFATTSIRIENSLGIVTHAGHWEVSRSEADSGEPAARLFVPSWVPNWDQISKMYYFTWLFPATYDADKCWQSILVLAQQVPWSIEDNRTLVTPGVFVDVVTRSMVCGLSDGSWMSFCADRINAHAEKPYPSGIPVVQALARLLLRGQAFSGREPLERFPDIATLVKELYPAFLASVTPQDNTEPRNNTIESLKKLGITSYEAFLEKILGKPLKALVPEAGTLLPVLRQMASETRWPSTADDPWPSLWPKVIDFEETISAAMPQYAAFVTSRGYIGWARKGLQTGDRVCVLPTCSMPVLLREVGSHSINLGPCYVEGLMHGEAVSCVREGTAEVRIFRIV